jgi:hypothetical protein
MDSIMFIKRIHKQVRVIVKDKKSMNCGSIRPVQCRGTKERSNDMDELRLASLSYSRFLKTSLFVPPMCSGMTSIGMYSLSLSRISLLSSPSISTSYMTLPGMRGKITLVIILTSMLMKHITT